MTDIIPRDLIKHLEWEPGKKKPKKKKPVPKPEQQKDISIDYLIKNGAYFENNNLPTALRKAYEHAGKEGSVASMPQLIAGKAIADKSNYLWKKWYTALSEENICIDKKGRFGKKGKAIVITVHNRGILTPDRIQKAYDEKLTKQYAAKYTEKEIGDLLSGILPNGNSIPFCTVDDVKRGITLPLASLPYAVVMDFETVKATESGWYKKKRFMDNPLVIARAGTLEYLETYFDKAKDSNKNVGCWHRFKEIDPKQPQGRLLFLGSSYYGLNGNYYLDYYGRFVGVAPEARRAKK